MNFVNIFSKFQIFCRMYFEKHIKFLTWLASFLGVSSIGLFIVFTRLSFTFLSIFILFFIISILIFLIKSYPYLKPIKCDHDVIFLKDGKAIPIFIVNRNSKNFITYFLEIGPFIKEAYICIERKDNQYLLEIQDLPDGFSIYPKRKKDKAYYVYKCENNTDRFNTCILNFDISNVGSFCKTKFDIYYSFSYPIVKKHLKKIKTIHITFD